ncbi:hypothetical protein Acid345_3732 [Candidatus Koribacter versatilis Ellin345]|uniref:Uncharacterized protein n=1 Tax=Koribacter versatilis (strain Ellin345) TaxID=204669 RepID=Q1IK67_KORVE|nr:hypothetical protein Acid345_3732 [Candidatus Koribacter versatilis Ellin345]
MPFYSQPNTCVQQHAGNVGSRFDPAKSDSDFPMLFCSLQCQREWISKCMSGLTLEDVFEIQERARAVIGEWAVAATIGR